MKKFLISLVLLCALVFSMPNGTTLYPVQETCYNSFQYAVESEPIEVHSDADFLAAGFSGSGTESSPYVLEGLNFTLSSEDAFAIWIENTNARFIIRNCFFTGYVTIINENEVSLETILLDFTNADNGEIHGNIFSTFHTALSMEWCTKNSIYENTFTQYESLDRPDGCAIHANAGRSNHSIYSNTITGCGKGIFLQDSSYNHVEDNTISYAETGVSLEDGSNYNLLSNNICQKVALGIGISSSLRNNATYNNIELAAWHGISIFGADNTISYNTITNVSNTHSELIHLGWGADAMSSGIEVSEGTGNVISWNNLIDNQISVKNGEPGNLFDYNYYSDYDGIDEDSDGIGDTNYTISGASPTVDQHPRMATSFNLPISGNLMPFIITMSIGGILVVVVIAVIIRRK